MDEGRELRRLRDRHESVKRATEQWLSILREMEGNGETGSAQYERYFQAYLQSRHQERAIDLELFNRRRGLLS
jgi:vacuolar-type H+-ATPase catalytic subunit A/Vma1